ncbi:hypothetical protein Pint_09761 [Pistacia integerrima]|uniref:Uncharacterized protein n=1 Tax=Pistacia integerrima TaxID=434235 RepID=A0ACC0XFP9_9ROSI|nr:hypothetical protein Pint_09761 [Pistacia integerrima]
MSGGWSMALPKPTYFPLEMATMELSKEAPQSGLTKMLSVHVYYRWRPSQCDRCSVFCHKDANCPQQPRPEGRVECGDLPKAIAVDNEEDKEKGMEEESEMGNSYVESDKASMVEFIKEGAVDLGHPMGTDAGAEVRNFVKERCVSLCALLETRVACNNRWDLVIYKVEVEEKTDQVMHCLVHELFCNSSFFCSVIYATNYHINRRELWHNLENFKEKVSNDPWLLMGDFKNFSRIERISHDSNEVVEGQDMVKACVDYYQNLLGIAPLVSSMEGLDDLFQSKVSELHCRNMIREVIKQEVKSVIFYIGDEKAPSPYGFASKFFKAAWIIVGDEVSEAIIDFFMNSAVIALVPKLDRSTDILELLMFREVKLWLHSLKFKDNSRVPASVTFPDIVEGAIMVIKDYLNPIHILFILVVSLLANVFRSLFYVAFPSWPWMCPYSNMLWPTFWVYYDSSGVRNFLWVIKWLSVNFRSGFQWEFRYYTVWPCDGWLNALFEICTEAATIMWELKNCINDYSRQSLSNLICNKGNILPGECEILKTTNHTVIKRVILGKWSSSEDCDALEELKGVAHRAQESSWKHQKQGGTESVGVKGDNWESRWKKNEY